MAYVSVDIKPEAVIAAMNEDGEFAVVQRLPEIDHKIPALVKTNFLKSLTTKNHIMWLTEKISKTLSLHEAKQIAREIESTLAQVRHLQEMDRSEYNAEKTLASEREANAILTEEVEQLTKQIEKARNDALREALSLCRMVLETDQCGSGSEYDLGHKAAAQWCSDEIEGLIEGEQP